MSDVVKKIDRNALNAELDRLDAELTRLTIAKSSEFPGGREERKQRILETEAAKDKIFWTLNAPTFAPSDDDYVEL